MTAVVNKLQRILGLRISEKFRDCVKLNDEEKPIVFITHMEHHSNQTSWLETIADVKLSNQMNLVWLITKIWKNC